ncbi:hypothetical protein BHM03_00027881 [Ensete ventricosum]|uniref:Uncharacterized protein n=1 Tax=Ensete ventricosum TaxID=4639 RepID=A0A445MHS6_ENSVE|nr:hypothetical protein BHM03_00027881 [Ensete ventricosum]
MAGVRAAAAGLQQLQWEMAGMAGGDEEVGRNCDGRRRKKQPRERKEAVASGGEMGQHQKCRRQMREEKGEGARVEQRRWWRCKGRKRWPAGEVAEGEGNGDSCAW